MMDFQENIEILIRARYPILYIKTHEEARVFRVLKEVAHRVNKKVFEWSITQGLSVSSQTPPTGKPKALPRTKDPLDALHQVCEQVEPAIFLFYDFHPFLTRPHSEVIRKLKEIAQYLKSSYRTLILVSPILELPVELEKETTVLDFPLPDQSVLDGLLEEISDQLENTEGISLELTPTTRAQLVEAARGLTLNEAENVFAKIIVKNRQLKAADVGQIVEEKRQLVRKSGLLEFFPSTESMETIGGLKSLKDWLQKRGLAFGQEAAAFGLRPPKGVLLLGVQGCGKSLCAKAISRTWKLPLLRFDLGRMFGSYVGDSEANTRKAIELAESIAPTVLWVDEIDKAFSGITDSTGSDSGTSARVLSTFLTWLAEKTSPVFVVATANNIAKLPPELLRKGRLDEIFFVDLPNENELIEIIEIQLRKHSRTPDQFEIPRLARMAVDFSGAEIEEAINSALYDAYSRTEDLNTEHIANAISQTVPLARTMDDQIKHLRSWAKSRARFAG